MSNINFNSNLQISASNLALIQANLKRRQDFFQRPESI
jgi:hypothetical protein